MLFLSKKPVQSLDYLIKEFWWFEEESQSIEAKKIIPDGYPEIILHLESPYEININGYWELQSSKLIAGQIKKHFSLRNTGKTKIFGIKLQPWVPSELPSFMGHSLIDKVTEIPKPHPLFKALEQCKELGKFEQMISHFSAFLEKELHLKTTSSNQRTAVESIVESNGCIDIRSLCEKVNLNERTLERHFKNHIGLTPKFYSRIIRFAHILRLVNAGKQNWAEIAYCAGYYDQAHFIRNFKEFTGEEPSNYGFSDKTLGNSFFQND